MKDFDTWFYVIAFVFYIVAQLVRGYKKAKSGKTPANQPQKTRKSPKRMLTPVEGGIKPKSSKKRKKFSFEDLLREFEESFEEKQKPEPPQQIPEREISGEYTVPVNTERKLDEYGYPIYEYDDKPEDEPERVMGEIKSGISYGRAEQFKIEEKIENPYTRILKEPDGLKKAVVLSEILNRKYF